MASPPKNSTEDTMKPPILHPPIMKIDAPDDSDEKEPEENQKDTQSLKNEFTVCSPSFRSSLQNKPFTCFTSKISKGILKPPQLNVNRSNLSSSFILKPSQLNPLPKNSSTSDKLNSEKTENSESSSLNGDLPKFVPLVVPEKTIPKVQDNTQPPTEVKVSNSTFVFGQNLEDRVVANENKEKDDLCKASTSLGSNGTSEMLFSSAIKQESKQEGTSKDKETKSLSESAREYEESRANKRKYEEVEVITGEEKETNILSVSCKLFSFNKVSSNWLELGRGTLRLNDLNDISTNDGDYCGSRIVFRTSGSLRVILNTKIWAEMIVEKANEKSIRITALDANGEIKVFLIMSNIEDSNRLYSHLVVRLEKQIAAQKRKKLEHKDD